MKFLLVAGEGETSRENVEAILEDFFYVNKGNDCVLVIPFYKAPSRGQVYAMQMAKDNKADLIVFAPETARLENVEKASIETTNKPMDTAIQMIENRSAVAYLLYSDDGDEFTEALSACKENGIPTYDLTAGGMPLSSGDPVAVKPLPNELKPLPKDKVQEALDALVKAIKESLQNG